MRRMLVAVVLATLCGTAAACGSGESPDASGRTSTAPGNATNAAGGADSTGGGGAGDTKKICADAQKVFTDSKERFSKEVTNLVTGVSGADQAARDKMVATFKRVFGDWAAGLREQASKATSPELKAALSDLATQITNLGAKIKSFSDLERVDTLLSASELDTAYDKVESLCS